MVVAGPLTPFRSAEILAVGSELLTPFRTDTNSLWLTGRLNEAGIEVLGKSVVADRPGALRDAIALALSRADIVVTSGGLGPTDDDLTREAIAAVAGVTMAESSSLVETIAARFARRNMVMPDINRRQAMVPEGATPLDNPNGTAPGLWVPVGGKVIVALPGPPRELQPMWDDHVAARVRERSGGLMLRRRVLKIAGRGESHVDEVAAPVYQTFRTWEPPIETSILASPGRVELHLSAQGTDAAELDEVLARGVRALEDAIGAPVFSTDGRELEVVVGGMLQERGLTLAAAESCTGGLLLGRLTQVPGSSAWVVGGVVAYDNRVKVEALGVSQALLDSRGAVSEPVALAMAEGVRSRLGADMGVGITGIAGPSGGSELKPVGTVVVAVCSAGHEPHVRTLRLPGDRAMVRRLSVQTALDMVRRVLRPDPNGN